MVAARVAGSDSERMGRLYWAWANGLVLSRVTSGCSGRENHGTKKVCRTFSDCTTSARKGMVSGCYPLDPFYKERGTVGGSGN